MHSIVKITWWGGRGWVEVFLEEILKNNPYARISDYPVPQLSNVKTLMDCLMIYLFFSV